MSLSRPTLAYLCIFALATFLASLVVLAPSPSVGLFPAREAKSLREQLLDADGGAVWDHVYVINLESRQDRRKHMESLSSALDIPFTFINAVTTEEPVVPFILDNLFLDQERAGHGGASLSNLSQQTGWGLKGDLTWRQHALRAVDVPSATRAAPSYPTTFATSSPPLSLIYPPKYRDKPNISFLGPTACYLSHLKTWSIAITNKDASFLVLKDDVDAEFNLATTWRDMSRSLERTGEWDMVYLGWLWSDERRQRPSFNPYLRRASSPAGTHAYSFSAKGVRQAWKSLAESSTLFQSPIDHDLPNLIKEETGFEAYSVTPPLVIPEGYLLALGSDVGSAGGIIWGGLLSDSATERYRQLEGDPVRGLTEEEVRDMLAVSRM